MSGLEGKRTIKLFCQSLSKAAPYVAWEEQKLDLGSIARIFGIEPSTLKLNGHLISRGVDLISSSVTWKSLLSFFSARGLSTGKGDGDELIIDGKLCKAGSKRSLEPQYVENDKCTTEHEEAGVYRRSQLQDFNLIKRKKLTENNSDGSHGLKRKQWLEVVSPLKKLKVNKTELASSSKGRVDGLSSSISKTGYPCSLNSSEKMKRMREDEVVVDARLKKNQIM